MYIQFETTVTQGLKGHSPQKNSKRSNEVDTPPTDCLSPQINQKASGIGCIQVPCEPVHWPLWAAGFFGRWIHYGVKLCRTTNHQDSLWTCMRWRLDNKPSRVSLKSRIRTERWGTITLAVMWNVRWSHWLSLSSTLLLKTFAPVSKVELLV